MILLVLLALSPLPALAVDGRAVVLDGDTLRIGQERIRLFGIDAPERSQICEDARGRGWPCGQRATAALRDLVGQAPVSCDRRERDRYGRTVALCRVAGKDLGAALVSAGMAFAYQRYSDLYLAAEDEARLARRGIWQGRAERPEHLRMAERQHADSEAAPSGGECLIKGNISERGRFYHLPGGRAYAKTRITPARGERWFCTEAEARAAGWQPAPGQ